MKVSVIYSVVLFCSFMISGCKFDEIKSVTTTGEMSIVVDENIEPLMKDEIREFERLNPEAKILMTEASTKKVVADLINGDSKFIVIARGFDEEEKNLIKNNKLEIKDYPLAIDGIGFIVNDKNPVKRVTSEDLKKVFSGEYQNWTDIKSQDEQQNSEAKSFFAGVRNKIKVYIQRKNSATSQYVLDSILRQAQYTISATVCSTSVQMLNAVRENESSIGIISMNWLSTGKQDTIDTTVKTLRISKIRENGVQEDFAEFHQGNIYNAKYPYRRTVYIYTAELGIKLSTGFITFLLNTDGQKVVLKNSLVPITQPVRTIQLN